ncbi:16S rRNA (uracil(1498)-N(3))-methyltransferase [Alcanivorax sp. 1008]|uniref:16S rRNA (uracil(1498)-N(3))-methyltransferase n=1 Tax=Alcanivorax sp. 1008 TaxID=2816853 RepID=UPI001D546DDC|nr:16S rRNA (uracil(1498)-N(3))-methyltransferase [Alcanivorax sp. 1008]MCC1495909.1 16S rRNA (uracil(1498)-N(3))-methyltransferase [Alcanivorax sp. 1008]
MRRFFDNQNFQLDSIVELGEDASHHISKVLRMQPGNEITLFNGKGGEWRARIEAIGKRQVQVLPLEFQQTDRTPSCAVHLALPVIKGDRMDYALQKGTELGAASFQLITTSRTEVRLGGGRLDKRLPHWQQVVTSACEQCGMNRIPLIHAPLSLDEYLQQQNDTLKLIAHPGEQPLPPAALQDASDIQLLTGPEGGFSAEELEHAGKRGFRPFALGQRVLRAETAPSALLAAIWMARGE